MQKLAGLLVIILACTPLGAAEPANEESIQFFEKQVRPLLVKRCYSCHAGTKASGGLSLETAAGWRKGGEGGPAIVPGKPEASLLIDAINYGAMEMPPSDQGGKLPAEEIAILTKWVSIGAPDPREGRDTIGGMTREAASRWWSFQALPTTTTPLTSSRIDELLKAKLDEQHLTASAAADKRTLIRRATYDLTGLPPTPAEVGVFINDTSPDAFDKVIDRLLESPQYGVHWGRHWLDVVRYADTAGENTDRPLPHAWRYRNWVIDSFNRDLPFNDFVRLQLAGDVIAADQSQEARAAGIVATGYLAIARRFGHDIDKDVHLTHEDVIDNVGKNFLGLTLGCARCHDHKYDAVTAADYYALSGVFQSTRFAFPGCEPKGQPRNMVPLVPQAEVDSLMATYRQQLAEFEQRGKANAELTQRLKKIVADSSRVLAEAQVGEGKSVSIHEVRPGALDRVAIKRGQVLQLVVLPNGSHGADTTRVELEIQRVDGTTKRTWSTADIIAKFTDGGPAIQVNDATWCLLDISDGPLFLHEKKLNLNGKPALKAWAIGDTPSAFVNASAEAVDVWTKLPAQSFFLHPGPARNVAVAWICPEDGEYEIHGAVTDSHPAAIDGVAFRCEHIASADYGSALATLGMALATPSGTRPEPPSIPVAYAVVEAEAKNAKLHLRGDPEKLGDEIPRRWLSVFGGQVMATTGGSGRRELADQIVAHPLMARVMANRVWQWHFGRGLVASSNDFGARGDLPTHPELLDQLAVAFKESGYQIKPLHRMIMKTAAYQRASTATAPQAEADADNRWLSHFTRRRLTAEEIRDSILQAGGKLDSTIGEAHPFPPESSWTYTQHTPFNAIYATNRRSAFLMVQRQRRHPYLALFDGADPNSSTAARQATTIPTQALFFLNDPFFHEQAAAVVATLDNSADEAARMETLYRRLYERSPSAAEATVAKNFISQHPGQPIEKWSALARVLMAANEFLYID